MSLQTQQPPGQYPNEILRATIDMLRQAIAAIQQASASATSPDASQNLEALAEALLAALRDDEEDLQAMEEDEIDLKHIYKASKIVEGSRPAKFRAIEALFEEAKILKTEELMSFLEYVDRVALTMMELLPPIWDGKVRTEEQSDSEV